MLAVASLLLTGCQPAALGEPVGQLVISWSQPDHEIQDLQGLPDPDSAQDVLLRDAEERDAFVTALPPDMGPAAVQEVYMTANVLTGGGYANCNEEGQVYFDSARGSLWFEPVSLSDGDVVCDWSPFTVEVWRVPLEQLDGVDPPRWNWGHRTVEGTVNNTARRTRRPPALQFAADRRWLCTSRHEPSA